MKYQIQESEPWLLEEDRDLRERTKSFALRIVRMFSALPRSTEAQVLGKQVLRSGTSVGANYREASRLRSNAGFISKIGGSLKELDESAYWLELLVESAIVPAAKVSSLADECNQLTAIFTTISKNAKKRLQSPHPASFILQKMLPGITNHNEYYSQHYFLALLEGDLKQVFARWEEAAAEHPDSEAHRPPPARLRAQATPWFRLEHQYVIRRVRNPIDQLMHLRREKPQ